MEFAVYGFLFLILFIGVLFNLKISNTKRISEIKGKLKKDSNSIIKLDTSSNDF